MEELIQNLADKVGLDRATAEKVADFIKDNASSIPGWIASSGLADKLPGGLGDQIAGFLGGEKE